MDIDQHIESFVKSFLSEDYNKNRNQLVLEHGKINAGRLNDAVSGLSFYVPNTMPNTSFSSPLRHSRQRLLSIPTTVTNPNRGEGSSTRMAQSIPQLSQAHSTLQQNLSVSSRNVRESGLNDPRRSLLNEISNYLSSNQIQTSSPNHLQNEIIRPAREMINDYSNVSEEGFESDGNQDDDHNISEEEYDSEESQNGNELDAAEFDSNEDSSSLAFDPATEISSSTDMNQNVASSTNHIPFGYQPTFGSRIPWSKASNSRTLGSSNNNLSNSESISDIHRHTTSFETSENSSRSAPTFNYQFQGNSILSNQRNMNPFTAYPGDQYRARTRTTRLSASSFLENQVAPTQQSRNFPAISSGRNANYRRNINGIIRF